MLLRKMTRDEMESVITGKQGKLEALLSEFIKMDTKMVEVTSFDHKDAYSAAGALRAAIKRFHRDSIECTSKDGKVYLINHSVKHDD